jgi:hypothetical protein
MRDVSIRERRCFMSTIPRLAGVLTLAALLTGLSNAGFAAGASAAEGSTLQRAERAASGVAGKVDKAVLASERAVKRGARAAERGIEHGVKAANRGADRVGAKVGLPPGSAPTGKGPQAQN